MEKDPNINQGLLDLLWLAKLQEAQQTLKEEEELRSEYLSQKHISFFRSKEVAYHQDLCSVEEKKHISLCSHCQARIRGFQRSIHPLNSLLFIYQANLASEALKEAIKTHVDNGCSECGEKINSWLGKLANKLKNVVEKSKTVFDYMCYQLDNNFSIDSKEFPPIGSYAPKSQQLREAFDVKVKAESLPLNIYLQEFPGNKLRVAVSATETSIKYLYIHIIGQDKTFSAVLTLTIKNQKTVGETFLPNFDGVIQKLGEKIYIASFPIDEAAYKELSNLLS